jgi:hypothetical protein
MGRGRSLVLLLGGGAATGYVCACAAIIGIGDRLPDDADAEPEAAAVDAADSAAPCTCVATPDGWTLVALYHDAAPPCAEGYGSPSSVTLAPADGGANPGCSCTCTTDVLGSCGTGNVSMNFYNTLLCSPATGSSTSAVDGGCNPLTPGPQADYARLVTLPTPVDPTCPEAGVTAPIPLPHAELCAARTTCATSQSAGACAPPAPGAFSCLTHPGDVACPSGFPDKLAGGSSVNDTRSCASTCSCAPSTPPCTNELVEIFTDDTCGAGRASIPPGVCAHIVPAAGDAGTFVSLRYTGKPAVCQGGATEFEGGVTLVSPVTICCVSKNGGGGG